MLDEFVDYRGVLEKNKQKKNFKITLFPPKQNRDSFLCDIWYF